ncbi:MAG: penicillin acylase family protein [Bacteroidales bacterium]
MRIFRRILVIFAIALVLAIIAGGLYVHKIAHRALPDYNDDIEIEGVEQEVEVYRDSLAIPHIYAQTEKDLYTAVGYLMAQDRLWQMDLLRRVTQGRLSEIFGEQMVENDHLMRSLRIPQKSKKVLARSDEKIRTALQAFSSGVNEYINTHSGQLPPEFAILGYKPEKWKPIHTVNLIGYMAWDLTPAWESEIILHKIAKEVTREKYELLIPKTEEQRTRVYPGYSSADEDYEGLSRLIHLNGELENMGLKIFTGSNNWAVSAAKSKTGKPLLANDMHLGLFSPGIWYQMHQVVEGKMDVSGVALPGQPMIISGHNDSIAWGMTNVMLDDMDFYRETINPEDSCEYLFNGKWRKLKVKEETIEVKGGDPVKKTIRYTHRGPVVSGFKEVDEETISMRWVGNEYSNELRSVYYLNRASNWTEFKDALRTFSSISQNIAYADVQGNIGLYCCAGVPVRDSSGPGIYPGETDQYDWKGLVPFGDLPHAYNPDKGFVASANNKTVGSEYPHHFSHWFDLAPRINRIEQQLQSRKKLSVQDFMEIQTDYHSLMVPQYKEEILKHARNINEASGELEEAIELLDKWNGHYSKNSAGAAIFEQFYITFVKNLIKDELGEALYKEYITSKILVRNLMKNIWNNQDSQWCDDVNTQDIKESFGQIVQKSFQESIKKLTEELGDTPGDWRWGEIHPLMLKHPVGGEVPVLDLVFNMNRGPFETGGSFHTVCVYSYPFTDVFNTNHGASHRHVYSIADWNRSRTVIPTGTSGIPASFHYCDQTNTYINREYYRELFSKEKVRSNARYHMTIKGK